MTAPTPLSVTPAREIALDDAIHFHRNTDTDDPRTVIETAQTFLIFLTADGIPFTGEDLERVST